MDGDRLLLAIGLVRQARPAGFCPACRVLMKALDARQELAKPTVAALVVLAVAGVAWAVMVQQSRSMAGMRSEEHTSELQSRPHLVCRLLLEKKKRSRTVVSRVMV